MQYIIFICILILHFTAMKSIVPFSTFKHCIPLYGEEAITTVKQIKGHLLGLLYH